MPLSRSFFYDRTECPRAATLIRGRGIKSFLAAVVMRGRRLDTCCVQSLVIQCGYAYLVNSKFSANNRQCFDFCISQMIRVYFCKEDIINDC